MRARAAIGRALWTALLVGELSGCGSEPVTPMRGEARLDAGLRDGDSRARPVCEPLHFERRRRYEGVDVVIAVDTSGSMVEEEDTIEAGLTSVVDALDDSGLDYRALLIADTPLGPFESTDPEAPPGRLRFAPIQIGSGSGLCVLKTVMEDREPPGPFRRWSAFARPGTFKQLVIFTDDEVGCEGLPENTRVAAERFDAALLAIDDDLFGDPSERAYRFHTVAGLGTPTGRGWRPEELISGGTCATAVRPGIGYQHLSRISGGMRYSVCDGAGLDTALEDLPARLADDGAIRCELTLTPPRDHALLPDSVSVALSIEGEAVQADPVGGDAACTNVGYRLDRGSLQLCAGTCERLDAAREAALDVSYDCVPRPVITHVP